MKCDVCGTENKENALFCAECGKALKEMPIDLDLQQIAVPASARKARIVKVSAKKTEEVDTGDKVQADSESPLSEQAQQEQTVQEQAAQASKPEAGEPSQDSADGSEFIPLDGSGIATQENASAQEIAADSAAEITDKTALPMKIKNWLPVFILCMIPCVNIIMLFIWSFSSKTNQSKRSFAQLSLIFMLIGIILCVAAYFAIRATFGVSAISLWRDYFTF